MSAPDRPAGTGRLLTGVAWAVLLLGLWLWGRDASGGMSAPTTGDVAAVGRPLGAPLPPAREPLDGAAPRSVEVPSVGIDAPVVPRGLDKDGAIDPPPYDLPQTAGWYGKGTEPGAEGAALIVGHVDTESEPAVFYGLSAVQPGEKVRVVRDDGSVAEFTVDDVQVVTRERFDAEKAYGPRVDGRAELRLITCGGKYDEKSRSYTANVVVSAYLTGAKGA
ncbi:class F sortase [Streptomyces microflavus]|uniref:Class F sortase n=1 Tax=Streptomyces microflavus TaxID=1919 RepID=A0A7H8MMN0_STRMI|nr:MULTISPECIES: class F sortase [Streptomyces]MBW3358637.1 class F sortase [Streptomyces sp. 09ZI22]MEE1731786.1 class F sortase [Streptomyces sp. BE282]QKW43192.1 class F sortase [Streptomyces microflavus]QQZ54301.1 class F sortase [Streptomyces microflavus]WSR91546.1 class F sortase [Streptomyces microflavus]